MSDDIKDKLYNLAIKFIDEYDIHCSEKIYQSDDIITNAYDFISDVCDIVGYKEYQD